MIPIVETQMDIMIQMEKQYFCLVTSPNSYIKPFYEDSTNISLKTKYDLQYISVEMVQQNETEILTKIRLKRKYSHHKSYYEENKNQKVDH